MIVKITFDGLGGPPATLFASHPGAEIEQFQSRSEVERRFPLGPMEMVDDGQRNF